MYRNDNTNTFSSYIKNNLTGKVIPFPVTPQLSESVSANYTQQDIIGASRPRILYSNTGAETKSLSLKNLTEDYLADGFSNLYEYVKSLKALAYPNYTSSGVVKSPNATLFIGDRRMSCVVTNVSVSWGEQVKNSNYLSCNVDMTLLMTRDNVPRSNLDRS